MVSGMIAGVTDFNSYESDGTEYRHFARTLRAILRQNEYRPSAGLLSWWMFYQLRWFIFLFFVKRYRPRIFTIERNGEVVGSISLTRSGELANVVVTADPLMKSTVIRMLRSRIDTWLAEERYFRVRTFDANRSLIQSLLRRGFNLSEESQYVITVPLGPLSFSWISRSYPRRNNLHLKIRRLCVLERIPRQMLMDSTSVDISNRSN